ncbi:hypothetical protein XENOCAPTIV_015122 [Xenoophorus captivus]|uniref:Uncharacterized protein n=1 Tax=Xenoophorus captivus TaxID=1517983 RepID=A0ABV0R0I8_9TELE
MFSMRIISHNPPTCCDSLFLRSPSLLEMLPVTVCFEPFQLQFNLPCCCLLIHEFRMVSCPGVLQVTPGQRSKCQSILYILALSICIFHIMNLCFYLVLGIFVPCTPF